MMNTEEKLKKELDGFKDYWKNGTNWAKMGWIVAPRMAIFQDLIKIADLCITPYINQDTVALEIGADGGFWTQKLLDAKEINCLDALSPEHAGFWDRIPKQPKIKYFKVQDFNCNELLDGSLTYLFSYDTFCHISYSGCEAYLKNLSKKFKPGANCFVMIADANKYYDPNGRNRLMARAGYTDFEAFVRDYDGEPINGRWYFYGIERFCAMCLKYGYEVVNKDIAVDADKLNPIVHFRKI